MIMGESMKRLPVKNSWGDIPEWAYDSARALMASLNIVDPLTYAHCLRVGEYSRKLAKELSLNEYEQKLAEFAGMFHDIGKIGVPQSIISKPSKLDSEEIEKMRMHPVLSEQIVQPLAHHSFFAEILPAIRGHHERLDGEGYPDKKMGDEIHVLSRIILIVDTYDAMSQTRAYRKGLPDEVVYAELKRCAGTQFDPQIVKTFLQAHPAWNGAVPEAETADKIIKKIA